jgi:poly-gamma-glutamate synthesis protein (capsule biosynthesis protein)
MVAAPSPSLPATSSTTATPTGPRLPLVLAVHATRAGGRGRRGRRSTRPRRRRGARGPTSAASGRRDTLVRGSSAASATRRGRRGAVQANRDTVAVVRADALGPAVAAVPVDGVDPVDPARRIPRVRARRPREPGRPDPRRLHALGRRRHARAPRRQQIAAARDPNLPFSQTADRLRAADLTVANLECALSRNGRPTQGGDSFGADASSLAGMRDAGFDVLVLANNHLGDYGDRRCASPLPRRATGSP